MCAAVLGVVSPLKTTFTVMMFVTVSQVITPVPVPWDCGCAGFSLSQLSPGATGPVAMKVRVSARVLVAERNITANTQSASLISATSSLIPDANSLRRI